MKIDFKFLLIVVLYIITPFQSTGQVSINDVFEKPKEFKLIAPLDLIFNLPESKNIKTVKQRSIFDANKLPIFCKIEHKLSKSSKVNLRMRLGSLDYVNKLEGKN